MRARELLAQIDADKADNRELPQAEELGATIVSTLKLPDIAELRDGLIPELPIYGTFSDPQATSLAGRADAVFFRGEKPEVVFDWKSDVSVSSKDIDLHAAQLRTYMRALNATRGGLVYMSVPKVYWLESDEALAGQ
jgi:PD-(D/E)XK nuclease superfamily protein